MKEKLSFLYAVAASVVLCMFLATFVQAHKMRLQTSNGEQIELMAATVFFETPQQLCPDQNNSRCRLHIRTKDNKPCKNLKLQSIVYDSATDWYTIVLKQNDFKDCT